MMQPERLKNPVRQDVGGCSGGVGDDQPFANESLGEDARQYGEEVEQASNSGCETRRRFFHDLGNTAIRSWEFLFRWHAAAVNGDCNAKFTH